MARHQATLATAGWDVGVPPGQDHLGAMHSAVALPLLSDWLQKVLSDWLQKTGWVK
ncbi:hypothetical protein [Pseudarthrobacter sp. Y6]|uniref:hypothetical protein n=1 Tax=Pseudarthrobacter sp. Y6 TaxID=3418422 RepID=UPI003CF24908